MKVVIQRVNSAKVTKQENNEVVGQIKKGLFLLLGVKKGDTKEDVNILVEKISKIRLMADSNDKMNLSVIDIKSEILLVSQFILLANTKDGNRPSFLEAEEPQKAKELYEYMKEKFMEKGIVVASGSFGDYMKIETELDGPVTIVLEN